MYLEVYGTSEAPKEENINLPQSNDESVSLSEWLIEGVFYLSVFYSGTRICRLF